MASRHVLPALAALLIAIVARPAQLTAVELSLPVDCELGKTCFIQQYADHDTGPGARDYTCGTATYDGHDGTDFRLTHIREVAKGVGVVATADGVVMAKRDGMSDRLLRSDEDRRLVAGRECGNGVMIDHGNGWHSQYCHMRQGSVAVSEGLPVESGQKLGEIGYSGAVAFPHVHLTVRHNGKPVDPFLGVGADPESCGSDAEPLWAADALAQLEYRPGELLGVGFAERALEAQELESGEAQQADPDRQSPALVAWGWAIKLRAGDELTAVLQGPEGELARNRVKLDRDKAQYMLFAGKKRPQGGWPEGRYRASFSVVRDGRPVIGGDQDLVLP